MMKNTRARVAVAEGAARIDGEHRPLAQMLCRSDISTSNPSAGVFHRGRYGVAPYEQLTWLAPSVRRKELGIKPRFLVQWLRQSRRRKLRPTAQWCLNARL
jgi:hypothetical protein